MGYSQDQVDLNVRIKLSKRTSLFKVFAELKKAQNELGETSRGDRNVYTWCDDFELSNDIVAMFESFRYTCRIERDHFVIDEFTGEKVGQCKLFWSCLKPLVEPGSTAEFECEGWSGRYKEDFLK